MISESIINKTYPTSAGVYLMKNDQDLVLYVGKAKNLKIRLNSYFTGGDGRIQIQYLLEKIFKIETIVCRSEEQAIILERDLITKYKPRYNIRLKDDKAYYTVRIDENVKWPRIELWRRVTEKDLRDGATYFGPFAHGLELRQLLEVIKVVVPLRTCTDTVLNNRQRPCLEYQLKRCLAPCCLTVDQKEYQKLVDVAIRIIKGKGKEVISHLEQRMESASEDLRFEEAAAVRDRLKILKDYTDNNRTVYNQEDEQDIFNFYREGERAVVTILRVRFGRIADTKHYTVEDLHLGDQELLEGAIIQFYEVGRDLPAEIILPKELDETSLLQQELLAKKSNRKRIEIIIPQKGSKYQLLELAKLNAGQHFNITFDSNKIYQKVASELALLLKLNQMPRRIEAIDISHLQGSDTVGAVVVFFDGAPSFSDYLKFPLKQLNKPDDFEAIYYVVKRRLLKGIESGELPDLIFIDGGKGQLNAAIRARDELNVTVDLVGIAKIREFSDKFTGEKYDKPERLFIEEKESEIQLAAGLDLTLFIQKVRNEVHRYVIGQHRKKRAKRVSESELDNILGIGVERKLRLLKEYKSIKEIAKRTPEEIAKVGRMSRLLAQKVLEYLRTLS